MYWNYENQVLIFEIWKEADSVNPEVLDVIMSTANSLCIAYAPTLPDGATVPRAYLLAEILQARHIWAQAGNGAKGTEFDSDGQVVPTYPLVFLARDLLRPKTSPLGRLGH
ncbi:hypothetical protein PSET11_03037 [Arthrobacter ulcerisalmonis]|uniref:Phage gp6-like head-tail connector protein n=1 Tax=Arthrobacter ulcerisalmonis TaxID=2483813 RepID=A0A3P5XC41_9MICC|nr:hypothetical protein PSET11_03037 [Arthrobacter ulcerisalmonis]